MSTVTESVKQAREFMRRKIALDRVDRPIQRRLVQQLRENRLQYASSIRCRFGGAYGNCNCG
jgi:hypothetical protein